MKLIHDYYILMVDQRYETQEGDLTAINTAIFRDTQDAQEQRDDAHYRHKRVYGKIMTCPISFTDEMVDVVDPGRPGYGVYIGHDFISHAVRRGMKGNAIPKYRCSTFEQYDKITRNDYSKLMDVQKGDRAYFSYLVTEPENKLADTPYGETYKLLLTDIFCVVRKVFKKGQWRDQIIMQGDWVLVEPNMESWQDIQSPSGIYKKPAPEAKYLEATVRHIKPRSDLKRSDRVYYEPVADVPLKVEGRWYYCMKESEILCLI